MKTPSNGTAHGIRHYTVQYTSVQGLINVHEKHQNCQRRSILYTGCTIKQDITVKYVIYAILLKKPQLQYPSINQPTLRYQSDVCTIHCEIETILEKQVDELISTFSIVNQYYVLLILKVDT